MILPHVFAKKQSHYNKKTYVKNRSDIMKIIETFAEIVDLQIVKFLLIHNTHAPCSLAHIINIY